MEKDIVKYMKAEREREMEEKILEMSIRNAN